MIEGVLDMLFPSMGACAHPGAWLCHAVLSAQVVEPGRHQHAT